MPLRNATKNNPKPLHKSTQSKKTPDTNPSNGRKTNSTNDCHHKQQHKFNLHKILATQQRPSSAPTALLFSTPRQDSAEEEDDRVEAAPEIGSARNENDKG
jgi:hypothetical protein